MVDFLFSYQHKAREIEALCLIKVELERRGYIVEFVCTFDPKRIGFARRAKPVVTVASALYDDDSLSFFVYDIAGFCNKVVNLQWEQVLSIDEEQDVHGYHNPKGSAKDALHLCWGRASQERLIKNGVPERNALVTGPVQMDFLNEKMRGYFYNKEELAHKFQLNPQCKWMIFVSSFTLTNMTQEEFADIVASVGNEAIVMKKVAIDSKRTILGWFRSVILDFPEMEFIYRPHPDENGDVELLELAQNNANFHIIPDYSVKQWVIACDRIFTWYSTAIADVYFAGKTCEILRPIEIPYKYDMSIYQGGRFIANYESFSAVLSQGSTDFPLKEDLVKHYFDAYSDTFSFSKVCDVLEKVYSSLDYQMKIPIKLKLRNLLYRNYNRLIGLLSILPYKKLFFFSKDIMRRIAHFKGTLERVKKDSQKNIASSEEIETIIKKLKNCFGR